MILMIKIGEKMKCNKMGFETKKEAAREGKRIIINHNRLRNAGLKVKSMYQYECTYCGLWHLTRQKKLKRKTRAAKVRSYSK